jgi:hypothetical protein
MLNVVGQERVTEPKKLLNAFVRDRVEDDPVLASRRNETAPAQTGEMIGDVRLTEPGPLDQLADPKLTFLLQQLEDSEAIRVPEGAEILRDEIGSRRGLRKNEGCGLGHPAAF